MKGLTHHPLLAMRPSALFCLDLLPLGGVGVQVQQALAHRSWGRAKSSYPPDELGGLLSNRLGYSATTAGMSSFADRASGDGSSVYGFIGEDGFDAARAAAEAGGHGSFTGVLLQEGRQGRVNASFTSSGGRPSSGERSFTAQRAAAAVNSDQNTPQPSAPQAMPPASTAADPSNSTTGAAAAGGSSSKAGAKGATGAAGAAGAGVSGASATLSAVADALAPFSKGSGGGTVAASALHHLRDQPDHRQVSFTDAATSRDNSHGHQRVQQPLVRVGSEEHMVQSSGHSGHSWELPDDLRSPAAHAAVSGRKLSYGTSTTFSIAHGEWSDNQQNRP